MRALEELLNRRWILKSKDRELYYELKEVLSSGEEKKFLMEKLGYQVIVNPYMIRKIGWELQNLKNRLSMYCSVLC